MTLQEELHQSRPFASLQEEATLALARTAAVVARAAEAPFRASGLTPTQYNVLRILRGAGAAGLCRHEIGARMVTPVPDVTRLLDRLDAMGLVARQRGTADRRQVRTTVTEAGLARLAALDTPLAEAHRQLLGALSDDDLTALLGLLQRVREAVADTSSVASTPCS